MTKITRVLLALAALALLLAALGCGATGRDALYGKWSGENANGLLTWEFQQGGKFLLSGSAYGDATYEATFEFIDDDTFSVSIPDFGYEGQADFKIDGDKLTVSSEGETVTFTRVK